MIYFLATFTISHGLFTGCDSSESTHNQAQDVSQNTVNQVDMSPNENVMDQFVEASSMISPIDESNLADNALGIRTTDFFPEGITRSDAGDFYIGSVNTGSIVKVTAGQKWAEMFVDGQILEGAGTAGLIADSTRGSLWACTGDFFGQIPSKIWQFDLQTAAVQAHYELTGRSFCNDLTIDDQGRIYATDSFGGRIFRVTDQGLEIWLEGVDYQPVNSPLSLNGITWDPQGKIWFGRSDTGQLSSVVINADGSAGEVELNQLVFPEGEAVKGIDGLKWRSDRQLIAIRGRLVYQLLRTQNTNGDYEWDMILIEDELNHATTFAFDESRNTIWVVESQLSNLYRSIPPELPFQVRSVDLPPLQTSE